MTHAQHVILLIARICFSCIFILSGIFKLMDFHGVIGLVSSEGLPAASLLVVLGIIFELGGGLMLLLGYKARYAAGILIIFMIAVTIPFHDFWSHVGMESSNQSAHFFKNIAMIGGALAFYVVGGGKYSLCST